MDVVTETDVAGEKFLKESLAARFPDHSFIGEEGEGDDKQLPGDEPTWIIDPVDGTVSFVHGLPNCCVSIGLCLGGTPAVGVIYGPVTDELFYATRGGGAFVKRPKSDGEPTKLSVSKTPDLLSSVVATGFTTKRDDEAMMSFSLSNFASVLQHCQAARIHGSCALDLCRVAEGSLDIYYEYTIHSWDMCAGMVIVHEAGGYTRDPADRELILDCGRIIAGREELVRAFLDTVVDTAVPNAQ